MNKNVTIELKDTRLENRRCGRCGHSEFYPLAGEPLRQMVSCSLDCGPSTGGCGHLLRLGFDGAETRCGDVRDVEGTFEDSAPASIALAMCYTCGKLVSLV
jgi:hypothetical protein